MSTARPFPPDPDEADDSPWRNEGLDAFAGDSLDAMRLFPSEAAKPAKVQTDTNEAAVGKVVRPWRSPFADFDEAESETPFASEEPTWSTEAAAEVQSESEPARPPVWRSRLEAFAYLSASAACFIAAIVIGLGDWWPSPPPSSAPSTSDPQVPLRASPFTVRPSGGIRNSPVIPVTPKRPDLGEEPSVDRTAVETASSIQTSAQPRSEATIKLDGSGLTADVESAVAGGLVSGLPLQMGTWTPPQPIPALGPPAYAIAEPVGLSALEAARETVVPDRMAIERLLRAYEDAYDRRDAAAVSQLWPSIDTSGVVRAFASVKEQDLTFAACDYTLQGDRATAECPGEIRFVRLVGGDEPQLRRAVWTITFARSADRWQVDHVNVR